ncbi:PREDICTED: 65-kDa microtubule-associated protein 8 [Tarenaya hassleriana]|uniref:65-kDa microtubule-associated protein 8 n=1 Tax=Tarenaya hassleriana TaxID=28532 RepID=UPI00053C745E|nr:PREDICTED: 65-kDa microtubule-associated protein 8 [Tarenaya hassleriana]
MGTVQTPIGMRSSSLLDTSCGYLLRELQMIWDEVGEGKFEREKVLLDIEQECVEAYRRKVDQANISRSRLHQELAESEAELTHLLLCLGERSVPGRPEKKGGTLKEQLDSIAPALREMRLKKEERVKQFRAVQGKIQKISAEIAGRSAYDDSSTNITVDMNDLSLKKLEEYQIELSRLHDEKSARLQRVEIYICAIRDLSTTLGTDASMTVTKVHPSLNDLYGISKNISDVILEKLNTIVVSLEEEKRKRLEKLHQLGNALSNLWNLMDAPYEDREKFSNLMDLQALSPSEVWAPGSLTLGIIQQAEAEAKRLDQLKASKTKEIFLKKQNELENICNRSHMETPSTDMGNIMNLVDSGEIDHADLLSTMNEKIARAKEEASSRKGIIEKVEKWISACDEERWLEEYNQDENRYSVSRGAHRNLRRAERARITVSKIPGLVESLMVKTKGWEAERQKIFLYDEVPLNAMLEEYNKLRQEKEVEKQRHREMKKILPEVVKEPENFNVPRPTSSNRRILNRSLNGSFGSASHLNRKVSSGIQQYGSNIINSTALGTSIGKEGRRIQASQTPARFSLASHLRNESASVVSMFSGPLSP